jgi:DNA polymerase-3 subunit gamma/tau
MTDYRVAGTSPFDYRDGMTTASSNGYQVLARKYRPQSFDDVAGQQSVVHTLVRALDTGRVAHAFLFTGSRGVGKTTLARILSRCLVCEKGVSAKPCGTCTLCVGVSAGNLTDVIEIDGASNNSVDQVRDLQEIARFLPQLARFKIFIVDEVHMLSTSAFNALLKILEEPPPHVKFIFATTEPHKIPVTILSRCQRYDFKRLPQKTIVERLTTVLGREGLSMARDGLDVIARAADGGMRDALSLTDQVLSFAGEKATVEQITEALGIIDARSIAAATDAAIAGDAKGALQVVEQAHQRGVDLRQLLIGIAAELRHLTVANAAGSVRGLADLTDEEAARLDDKSKQVDGRDLLRLLQVALDAMDPLARSDDARLHVETALLRMCRRPPLGDAMAISEALVRLEALKAGRPVPPLSPPPQSPPPQSPPPQGGRSPALDIVRAALSTVPTPPAQPPPQPTTSTAPTATPLASPMPSPAASPTAPSAVPSTQPPPASTPPREADLPLDDREDPPIIAAAPVDVASAVVLKVAPPAAPEQADHDDDDGGHDPAAGLALTGVDPRFIAFADHASRATGMHLDQARVVAIAAKGTGHEVSVCFERELHQRAVSDLVAQPALLDALASAFGPGSRLVVVPPPAQLASLPPSIAQARDTAIAEAQAALEAHAKTHPVVEKAVALFGGQVRAVKRKGV